MNLVEEYNKKYQFFADITSVVELYASYACLVWHAY